MDAVACDLLFMLTCAVLMTSSQSKVVLPCDKNESKRVVAKIDAVKSVPVFSDSQLLAAVAQQPISVGIAAVRFWIYLKEAPRYPAGYT